MTTGGHLQPLKTHFSRGVLWYTPNPCKNPNFSGKNIGVYQSTPRYPLAETLFSTRPSERVDFFSPPMKPKTAKYSAGQNHIWIVIYLDRKNVPVFQKTEKVPEFLRSKYYTVQNFYGPQFLRLRYIRQLSCVKMQPALTRFYLNHKQGTLPRPSDPLQMSRLNNKGIHIVPSVHPTAATPLPHHLTTSKSHHPQSS